MISGIQGTPLRSAAAMLDISADDLWVGYVGIGGDLAPGAVEGFLDGHSDLLEPDYDRLVQVVNELFMERDEDHPVPYSDELDEPDPL
jgi:hypothetical protein